jgi:type I restriction enzyme S subunit
VRSIQPGHLSGRELQPGDLLLEKSGGGELQPVGAVVLFDRPEPSVCSNFVARVVVREGQHPRFLTYIHAMLYAARVNTRSIKQSTGIQNLDASAYLNECVALPSLDEQERIADWLDKQTGHIDYMGTLIEASVDKLSEYRAALVTDAVTGHIIDLE